MKKFLFLSFLILPLFISSCKSSKKSTASSPKSTKTKYGVQFTKSPTLTKILSKAEAENKLVFVDFYTSWCLPCKMMDEDVFPDREIGKFMNKNFISYKVNGEKDNGINLAFLFQVNTYPTLLFIDQKGNVLEKKIGAAYHTELRSMGERAMAKHNQQL
ncbi:MAG: thioredoxin family protein [Saprospiraceae bacterium]